MASETSTTTVHDPALRPREGARVALPQRGERRLFMQVQAFGGCRDIGPVREALEASRLEGVLYLDANDPSGLGVLLVSEDPGLFAGEARTLLGRPPFAALRHKSDLTMFGRTYATGREPPGDDWVLQRPRRQALNPAFAWAIWYPLRRKPEFALLPSDEQARILGEHAVLGRAYGEAGLASDIRLACHGLDARDNEFVLGIVGPELYPLSRLIQDMRATQQTAKHIQSLGPFFVGRVLWQSPAPA